MTKPPPDTIPAPSLKKLNNPFPKEPSGLPFVRGSLSSTLQLPTQTCSWDIGAHFVLRWNALSGGSLSVHHRGDAPTRSLWSTLPGKAFVTSALGEATVEESHGSFGIHDKVLLVLRHQTVDAIRLVRRTPRLGGPGSAADMEDVLPGSEGRGRKDSGRDHDIAGVDDIVSMSPGDIGRDEDLCSSREKPTRITGIESSGQPGKTDGKRAAESFSQSQVSALDAERYVLVTGTLCSSYAAAKGRPRRTSRKSSSTTPRRRVGLHVLRPRFLLNRLRPFGYVPLESPRPPPKPRGARCDLLVRYSLAFAETAEHRVRFSIRLEEPSLVSDDGQDEKGSERTDSWGKRKRDTDSGEAGNGTSRTGMVDGSRFENVSGCQTLEEPQTPSQKRRRSAEVSATGTSNADSALSEPVPSASQDHNNQLSGASGHDPCLSISARPDPASMLAASAGHSLSPSVRRESLRHARLILDTGTEPAVAAAVSSTFGAARSSRLQPPWLWWRRRGAEGQKGLAASLSSKLSGDPKLASVIPPTPGAEIHRVRPRWLWWRRRVPPMKDAEAKAGDGPPRRSPRQGPAVVGGLRRWRPLAPGRGIQSVLRQWRDKGGSCPLSLNRVQLTYASRPDERFFGFGEQFSFFDFKGRRVPILVQEQGIGRGDQPVTWAANLASHRGGGSWHTTYAPVPQYMTSDMRCLFLEGYAYAIFDLRIRDRVQIQVHEGQLDGQIVHGSSPGELIERYTEAVGRMRELPEWIYSGAVVGMQGGTAAVQEVMQRLQDRRTPVSAFWLQDWCGQRSTMMGRQLWWNWELDEEHYVNWRALVGNMKERGIRVMGYINPYLAEVHEKPVRRRDLFSEASAHGFAILEPSGKKPYMIENTSFGAAMVDLTNPGCRTWLKSCIREMVAVGIRGWMADFSESLPFDACLHSGENPCLAHNRYPEMWAEINREVIVEIEAEERAKRRASKCITVSARASSSTITIRRYNGLEPALHLDGQSSSLSLSASVSSLTSSDPSFDHESSNSGEAEGSDGGGSREAAKEEEEAAMEENDQLVFFMRAGYRGSPKNCTLFWEGDQMVSWQRHDGIKSAVAGLLSSGLAGFAYNHSDIGGYTTVPHRLVLYQRSEELLQRWMEVNAFTVVFRTHEGNVPSANSQFYSHPRLYAHFDRCARIFKAWLFYRRRLVKEAAQTGMPVVRHMFVHYPQDREVMRIVYQQFMVGPDLLVAPVLDPGRQRVLLYLPPDEEWVHVWTGALISAPPLRLGRKRQRGVRVRIAAPLGQPCVLFRRGSAVGPQFIANLREEGLLPPLPMPSLQPQLPAL